MADITVFIGGFGSGKSELCIDAALQNAPCRLVDLDILNPCLRSSEHRKELEAAGVAVYAPTYAGSTLDLPVLPAELRGAMERPGRVFIDVGGDPQGAAALGQYHKTLVEQGYTAYFVVNALRPRQQSAADLLLLFQSITARARITPCGIINNTNLSYNTKPEHVMFGQKVAEELNIPTIAIRAMPSVIAQLPAEFMVTYASIIAPLTPRMRLPVTFS
ncbi:MAG: hypothetical protein FWD16_00065 [Clostridia bacterium]|nr:hypothetical protein [Clostridia bacterium]